MNTIAVTAFSIALTCNAAFAGDQASDDAGVKELRDLVNDLQSQVDQLKAQNDTNWLTERRAQEIRGLVQDVLADADTRASLLESGAVAGWDKGFFIASADGDPPNFRLQIGGQIQIRYVYNIQDESPTDDNRSGFELRRSKLIFTGNVVDPSWKYELQLAADRATGVLSLEDAGWIQKDFGNGWKIWVGQMKAPFLREEVLSSRRLFAIERSLVNSQFTAGTVQGVQVGWEGDKIHAYGMFHDGNNSRNTAWSVEDTEYAFSGRVEWLASGEWKNLADYSSFKDEGTGVVVGGGVNYSKQEFGTGSNLPSPDFNNAEVENFSFTADVTVDFGGASVAGAVVYRNLQTDTGSPGDLDLSQLGFFIRGGYFIADDWELYAQYEWGDLDISGIDDLSVFTIGATKYWAKHALKWQTDFGYGLNSVASSWAQDSTGWRTDAADQDGQIVIRTQIQLLF